MLTNGDKMTVNFLVKSNEFRFYTLDTKMILHTIYQCKSYETHEHNHSTCDIPVYPIMDSNKLNNRHLELQLGLYIFHYTYLSLNYTMDLFYFCNIIHSSNTFGKSGLSFGIL